MDPRKPIGVFDSGVGGLSILRALRRELPLEDFVYFSDAGHGPYGERDDAFVAQRSRAIALRLLGEHGAKALVVACNTATAAAVHLLRTEHGQLPCVGVEPALRPAAAATRTGRVAVFATRSTLSSAKFRALQESLQGQAEFVVQPCDGLAAAIEEGRGADVRDLCRRYAGLAGEFGSAPGRIDTLVLGCTHYAFAHRELREAVGPDVRILETGEAVARQARRLLEARDALNPAGQARVSFVTTGSEPALRQAAKQWLSAAGAAT